MFKGLQRLVLLVVFLIPLTGQSCEPIVPLFHLLSGSTLAGPAPLTKSFLWLGVAVVIKCSAFVFLEIQLPWRKAIVFMVLANVLSTIPGLLLGVFTGSIAGFFFSLPLVIFLALILQRRFLFLPESTPRPWFSGGWIALGFIGFFFISVLLYGLAGSAIKGHSFAGYWVLKFLFVALVACTGIIISAVLEECVIARLARNAHGNLSFFTSVFRANYITLGIVLFVITLEMLPKRLNSPNFLVSWLSSLSNILGPT
ncbi:MAG: hypothetical protein ABIP71_07060 [Verrucomicrobiota bacterium]